MLLASTAGSRVLAHIAPPILKIHASSAIEFVGLEDFRPLGAPALDALAKVLCLLICPAFVPPARQGRVPSEITQWVRKNAGATSAYELARTSFAAHHRLSFAELFATTTARPAFSTPTTLQMQPPHVHGDSLEVAAVAGC